MKKILLFSILSAICFGALAQNRISVPANIRNISLKKPMYFQAEPQPNQNGNNNVVTNTKSTYLEEIGGTVYDLQTNASVDHRCYLFPDGTIGTTFTLGTSMPNFPERGTGYQYFDGTAWLNPTPSGRIESMRTGWPSYSHLGANGEVVIAHNGTQLVMNKRNIKGTGAWSESLIPTPTGTAPNWPRIAVSGNTIHVLAAHQDTSNGGPVYQGQVNSLLYYRSQDGGTTWDTQAQILSGLDAASGFIHGYGSDCYAWSEPRGDTIAFVVGNNWTDLNLMKSLDGGNTWTKTIIFQHPYPNFSETHTLIGDGVISVDTPYVCDGHLAVQLDTAGKAHVVFGIMRVVNADTTDGVTNYFPATDGLAYWKEGDPTFMNLNPDAVFTQGKLIAWVQDHDGSGVLFDSWMGTGTEFGNYGTSSLCSQPQISIDNNNDIYVVYVSPVEDQMSVGGQFFNHIWGRRFKSSLNSWGEFIEVTSGPDFDFVECVYPAMSKTMDNKLHIVFEMDFEPGLAVTGDVDPYGYNSMIYFSIDKSDFVCSSGCNNISGLVFSDDNQNGIKDPGEQGIAGQIIKMEPGPYFTSTNNNGNFFFAGDLGNHIISYMPQQYWNITSDSTSYAINLNGTNTITGLTFGAFPNVNIQDVGVYLTGEPVRPGFTTTYWISYKNLGTQTLSGDIYHNYAPILTHLFSHPTEQSLTGNVLDFTYDTLASQEQRMIISDFQVPADVQLIGDTIISYCHIEPLTGDINLNNNYDSIVQVITGSYDPNDKSVSPMGLGTAGYVLHGQKLTYTIRFQNTGNDTAFTVMVKDTLDTDMNTGTFNILASSHPVTYEIQGTGIITFTFNNILLPDSNVNEAGSNGFVKYSIEPKAGLADFTEVKNKAYIYFDYNPPVITNEVINTYVSTLTGYKETLRTNLINIYPNPSADKINLVIKDIFGSINTYSLYDIKGKEVLYENINNYNTVIDVSKLEQGIYFLKVVGNSISETGKVVIVR